MQISTTSKSLLIIIVPELGLVFHVIIEFGMEFECGLRTGQWETSFLMKKSQAVGKPCTDGHRNGFDKMNGIVGVVPGTELHFSVDNRFF